MNLNSVPSGTRVDANGLNAKEMQSRDGHSFAYILHYVCTGDLIYPLHEGFHRVDALLKVPHRSIIASLRKRSQTSVRLLRQLVIKKKKEKKKKPVDAQLHTSRPPMANVNDQSKRLTRRWCANESSAKSGVHHPLTSSNLEIGNSKKWESNRGGKEECKVDLHSKHQI